MTLELRAVLLIHMGHSNAHWPTPAKDAATISCQLRGQLGAASSSGPLLSSLLTSALLAGQGSLAGVGGAALKTQNYSKTFSWKEAQVRASALPLRLVGTEKSILFLNISVDFLLCGVSSSSFFHFCTGD